MSPEFCTRPTDRFGPVWFGAKRTPARSNSLLSKIVPISIRLNLSASLHTRARNKLRD